MKIENWLGVGVFIFIGFLVSMFIAVMIFPDHTVPNLTEGVIVTSIKEADDVCLYDVRSMDGKKKSRIICDCLQLNVTDTLKLEY